MSTNPPKQTVRLFPLAGVVLLPHSWLPLHIFEPRYRQMTEDALEGDGRIAIVLPRSTESFEPPVYDVACVGRIVNEQRLDDGRYLFLLHGEQRVRLLRECETDKLYRIAEAVCMTEVMEKAMQARRILQRAEIMKLVKTLLPTEEKAVRQFIDYLQDRCNAGAFADIIAYSTPITLEQKQRLLEELSVDRRLELLGEYLTEAQADAEDFPEDDFPFPPPFEDN